MNFKKYIKFLPAIALTVFIAVIVYQADTNPDNYLLSLTKIKYLDKVAHFSLFGLLAFSVNKAIQFKSVTIYHRSIYIGSVVILLIAIIEEFSQISISSRTFDLVDILFDIFGILFFSSNWLLKYLNIK